MAALAVMAVGVLSAQASAASLSVNVNQANGRVNVGLSDNDCNHAHNNHAHKKVVKHKVVHHKVAAKHGKKRHEVCQNDVRLDNNRKHRR